MNFQIILLICLFASPFALGRRRGRHGRHGQRMRFFVPATATDDASCDTEATTAQIIDGIPGKNNTALDSLNPGDSLTVCIQKRHRWCQDDAATNPEVEVNVEEVGRGRGFMKRMKDMVRGLVGGFRSQESCNSWRYVAGSVMKTWHPNFDGANPDVEIDVERVAGLLDDSDDIQSLEDYSDEEGTISEFVK